MDEGAPKEQMVLETNALLADNRRRRGTRLQHIRARVGRVRWSDI